MAKFEGQERRMAKINKCLAEYGFKTLDEARDFCLAKGIDVEKIVKGVQTSALKTPYGLIHSAWHLHSERHQERQRRSEDIGIGLEAFCVPGSGAVQRNVGLGQRRLGAMLLRDENQCFCFLAGHESFAAARGCYRIAEAPQGQKRAPPHLS
jgi:hypothetical protein